MTTTQRISSKFPKTKFFPPRLIEQKTLFRADLFAEHFSSVDDSRFIFLEAQAGQGKTTVAVQLLDRLDLLYIWYQVGQEDRDFLYMFRGLLAAARQQVPGYNPEFLENKLLNGEISTHDLPRVIKLFFNELVRVLSREVIFVVDDLHLIGDADQSIALLDSLLEQAPGVFKFCLLSRNPLPLRSKRVKYDGRTIYLTNSDLALSKYEGLELFEKLCLYTVDYQTFSELHRITEGWIMGMILMTHGGVEKLHGGKTLNCTYQSVIYDYFREQLFLNLSDELQYALIQLSLMEEIPTDLAIEITGKQDIAYELASLQERNIFIRALDNDSEYYGFHHLFLGFLRSEAQSRLPLEEKQRVLDKTAQYWLARQSIEKAIYSYSTSENHDALEELMADYGMELVAQNRLVTLSGAIDPFLQGGLNGFAWLSLVYGMILLESIPEDAMEYFKQALHDFRKRGDKAGELITLGQIINFHVIFTGSYVQGVKYFRTTVELFSKAGDTLKVYDKIVCLCNISIGYTLFFCDLVNAQKFNALALELAERHEFHNLAIHSRMVQTYTYLLPGYRRPCMALAEKNYSSLTRDEVSLVGKLNVNLMLTNVLEAFGEFGNYHHQRELLIRTLGKDYVDKSIFGTMVEIWDARAALAKGDIEAAYEMISTGLLPNRFSMVPQLRSQLLEYQALIVSFSGKSTPKPLELAEQSHILREESGGVYFAARNQIILALVYIRSGVVEKGFCLFKEGIETAINADLPMLVCSGFLLRAYANMLVDRVDDLKGDLASGLKIMRKHRYHYFWGWYPPMVKELLQIAVRHNIETTYANKLAREQLELCIQNSGKTVPLLKIMTLGSFNLELNGKIVATGSSFTPMQRELLAVLLASPNLQLEREKIQVELWPDNTTEKAHAAFDTLMSRLRTTMKKLFSPYNLKHYFVLSKGILSLNNCRLDARDFMILAGKGMDHIKKEEYWQAGNCFFPAMQLWRGCFTTDIFSGDHAHAYSVDLHHKFSEMAVEWGDNLNKIGYRQEALKVLQQAWNFNRSHSELVKLLYEHYLYNNNPIQARQTLRQYEETLKQEEFSEDEIHEIISHMSL